MNILDLVNLELEVMEEDDLKEDDLPVVEEALAHNYTIPSIALVVKRSRYGQQGEIR